MSRRRTFIKGAAAVAAFPSIAIHTKAQSRQVVVASWGGTFQDAQRETMFKPFEQATGIKLVEATGPSLAKVRAMVESRNVEWDVTGMTPGDLLVLAKNGMAEKIDYANYFKGWLDDVDPRVRHEFGIGNFFYSKVIGYSTKVFKPGQHPKSWAEFWDVQKFPGPRMIDVGDWVVPPAEYALLADGVAPDKLYPLDLERAYRSMGKLRPHVAKFARGAAMPPQALVDGEVVLAAVTLGRILALKEQGAAVDFELNQGMMQFDYWMIPKGAKNYDAAMKFIEFATRPEIQAALVKTQALGPVNRKAFEHLTKERAASLPSHPDHLSKQILLSADYWASTDASGKSNIEKNAELWNRYSLQWR
ncbi:MAG: ABC transporter substrate-binding protein [Alphaproteobacteria bacterium]|nr:ABC transporter substrate-binding protein [Alphaproteobacteria bacterium]